MRDLFLFFVFGAYLLAGFAAAFAATLGYLWVDLVSPQAMGFSFLKNSSLSLVMGAAALFFFVFSGERKRIRITMPQVLLLVFAAWITLTTTWAQVPDAAWWKWDWAIKTVLFAFFAPLVINSRVRFEAFMFTFVFAIALNYLPIATKTILSGGGYGRGLSIVSGNSKLSESSTLAMASIMIIPLTIALYRHNSLFSKSRLTYLGAIGLSVMAVVGMFGTYARTGLVCLIALLGMFVLQSKRRIPILAAITILGLAVIPLLPGSWSARMETIENPMSDSSASTRIGVWKWTWDFVNQNPLGGGFEVYRINRIPKLHLLEAGEQLDVTNDSLFQKGRAFHSIYFEVLGEHGFPGLVIYLAIAGSCLLLMRRIYSRSRNDSLDDWRRGYAIALSQCIIVFLAGGAFIGVAYQSISMFTLSMAAALSALDADASAT